MTQCCLARAAGGIVRAFDEPCIVKISCQAHAFLSLASILRQRLRSNTSTPGPSSLCYREYPSEHGPMQALCPGTSNLLQQVTCAHLLQTATPRNGVTHDTLNSK